MNSGKLLKTGAVIIAVAVVLIGVYLAVIMSQDYYLRNMTFPVFLGSIVIAAVSALPLYAFGDIADDTHAIRRMLEGGRKEYEKDYEEEDVKEESDDSENEKSYDAFRINNGALSEVTDYGRTLHDVTVPDEVTTILARVFKDCSEMVTLQIGPNVTSIGTGAFKGCVKLEVIYVDQPKSDLFLGTKLPENCRVAWESRRP